MKPWWLGLPAAQATIACGEQTHRLRWQQGELQAVDHDDIEAERTLAALGDQRCACADVLDAWTRHASDLRVLVLASRGPTDPLAIQADQAASPSAPIARPRRPGRRSRPGRRASGGIAFLATPAGPGRTSQSAGPIAPEDELQRLFSLGGALPERLVATVASEWATRLAQTDATHQTPRAQLHAALYGHVTAAVRNWLGEPDREIELRMIGSGDTPTLTEDDQGLLRVELPFEWLADIFVRGLAVVWGRFCLTATTTDGQHWTLSTITPDLAPAQPMTVQLPASE